MRRRLIAIFIVVVLMASFIPMPAAQGLARENEPLLKQETLQPLGTQFEIDGILSWTPESDPDARYNRSNVPLAERAQGFVVNPYANPNARMVLSGDAYPIGGTMSHSYGTDGAWRRYALNFWQYVDVYNFWGGPVNIPTPELMDMAHRNGVPVVGTVFFENRPVQGSERRIYYNQGTTANPYYPYGDKLWEIAEFYGFDGWFFNFESTGTDTTTNRNEIFAFLEYMERTKPFPHMIINTYDSPTTGGWVSGLNTTNRALLQGSNNVQRATYHFGDYKWTGRTFATTTQSAALGMTPNPINPYRVNSTWPIHMNSYRTIGPGGSSDTQNGLQHQLPWLLHNATTAATFNNALSRIPDIPGSAPLVRVPTPTGAAVGTGGSRDGWLMNSIGFFGGHSSINPATSVSDFLNVHDARLWVGYRGLAMGDGMPHDPSIGYRGWQATNSAPATAEAWVGVSQLLADKTVILDFPFVTQFNAGIGHSFYVDGEAVKSDWTNRGLQDLLPTWRWTVRQIGRTYPTSVTATSHATAQNARGNPTQWQVTPSFDDTTAWNGGTSINIKGNATVQNEIRLYSTFLDFKADTSYELTYVTKGSPIEFAFYNVANYSSFLKPVAAPVQGATVNGWTTWTQSLDCLSGMIYGFGVLTSTGAVDVNIGKIMIDNVAKVDPLPAVEGLTLDAYQPINADKGEARIYWDRISNDVAHRYEIYQVFADGTRLFQNATYANAFYLGNIKSDPNSPNVVLEVIGVDDSLQKGEAATISFSFGLEAEDAKTVPVIDNPNLVLDPDLSRLRIITSRGFDGEPGSALFDGDRVQSKWCFDGTNGASTSNTSTNAEAVPLVINNLASDNGHFVVIDTGVPITVSRWAVHNAGPIESVDYNTKSYRLSYIPLNPDGSSTLHFDWPASWGSSYRVRASSSGTPTAAENNLFEQIRGGVASGTANRSQFFHRGLDSSTANNWAIADRVINNPRTSAGDTTDRDFAGGAITARYWMFLVEESMWTTGSQALRVFMLELFEHAMATTPSEGINMNQVKIERSRTGDTVFARNIPTAMGLPVTFRVYDSLDATTPIGTATRAANGTATIRGLNLDPEGGRLFFDTQIQGYALSNRLSIPYYPVEGAESAWPDFIGTLAINTERFGDNYPTEASRNSVPARVRGDVNNNPNLITDTGVTLQGQSLTERVPVGAVKLWANAQSRPSDVANSNVGGFTYHRSARSPWVFVHDGFHGAIDFTGLAEGTRVFMYNNVNDIYPAKISAPVINGSDTTRIDSIPYFATGGNFWLTFQEPGQQESKKMLFAYTNEGEIDLPAMAPQYLSSAMLEAEAFVAGLDYMAVSVTTRNAFVEWLTQAKTYFGHTSALALEKQLEALLGLYEVLPLMESQTLVSTSTSTKDFISMVETGRNSNIYRLSFLVTKKYSNGETEEIKYWVDLNGNNANLRGEYDLGNGLTLIYDIRDNTRDIRRLEIVGEFVPGPGMWMKFVDIAEFPKEVPPLGEFIDFSFEASIRKRTGNENDLIIKVTEVYELGEVVIEETFSVRNNTSGEFKVGKYIFFVATQGNDKITTFRLVRIISICDECELDTFFCICCDECAKLVCICCIECKKLDCICCDECAKLVCICCIECKKLDCICCPVCEKLVCICPAVCPDCGEVVCICETELVPCGSCIVCDPNYVCPCHNPTQCVCEPCDFWS